MADDKAAEATPETTANDVPPEAKSETEIKEEKTPETPVTEPLTNGSSTPESPKVETPPVEEAAPVPTSAPAPAASPEPERQESKAETQPEQLPVNGLSLEEPKPEVPEVAQVEQSKPDEQLTAETTETVPAPEIPVKKEVCVEQMPLESPPPPLPANPPPSSVASFAATTMAPELTDASLANTAELAISAPHSIPDIKTEIIAEITPAPAAPPTCTTNIDIVNIENVATTEIAAIEIVATELSPPLKETSDKKQSEVEVNPQPETAAVTVVVESNVDTLESIRDDHTEMRQATGDQADIMNIVHEDQIEVKAENVSKIEPQVPSDFDMVPEIPADLLDTEPLVDMLDNVEDLPPPPPPIADEDLFDKDDDVPNEDVVVPNNIGTMNEIVVNSNHISENTNLNGVATENVNGNDEVKENLKNKAKDMLGNLIETAECNGNVEQVEDKIAKEETTTEKQDAIENIVAEERGADSCAELPPPAALSRAGVEPTPPASPDTPQELLPVTDKLADLIPEVPVLPELNTETLQKTTSDVAVNE